MELRLMVEKPVRELEMEKEQRLWFERKVNELQNVIREWERKDAVQRKEYEVKMEKEKRVRMKAEIRGRVEMEKDKR